MGMSCRAATTAGADTAALTTTISPSSCPGNPGDRHSSQGSSTSLVVVIYSPDGTNVTTLIVWQACWSSQLTVFIHIAGFSADDDADCNSRQSWRHSRRHSVTEDGRRSQWRQSHSVRLTNRFLFISSVRLEQVFFGRWRPYGTVRANFWGTDLSTLGPKPPGQKPPKTGT